MSKRAQRFEQSSGWTNTELTYGDSSNAYHGYDRFGRIAATLWKSGATVLVESQYGRNAVGGLMWRRDVKAASILNPTTQDNHWWHDGLHQVTRHDRGELTPGSPPITNLQQQENFSYDETGNWHGYQSSSPALVQGRAHNTANQITGITNPSGVVQPAYDDAGNMTEMPAPEDWTEAYICKWDAWNRLVEIRDDDDAVVGAYTYDARTRRIRKTAGEETRDFYYNNQWRCIQERVSNTVKAEYVYSPFDRWNLIRRRRSVSGTLDETRYVLRDYLNPVAIITTAGAVEERYGYEAFGPVRMMDANFGARGASVCEWNWLFHGEFRDGESDLYNYGYRYYHPQFGRWISRDPIGERGGMNLYGFVENSSANRVDVLGLACCALPPPLVGPPAPYDEKTHCCCDGEIHKRELIEIGVKLCSNYKQESDYTPTHAWLEYPGASVGFWPGGDWINIPFTNTNIPSGPGVVFSPDPYVENPSRQNNVWEKIITANPCEIDVDKFIECLQNSKQDNETERLNYRYGFFDCRHWAIRKLEECKGKAERKCE